MSENGTLLSQKYDRYSCYRKPVVWDSLLSKPLMQLIADYGLNISGVGGVSVLLPTKFYKNIKTRFYGPRCKKFFDKYGFAKDIIKRLGCKKYGCAWTSIDQGDKPVLSVCGIYDDATYVVCYNGKQQQEQVYRDMAQTVQYDVGEAIFHTLNNFGLMQATGNSAKSYVTNHPKIGQDVEFVVEARIAQICDEVRARLAQNVK